MTAFFFFAMNTGMKRKNKALIEAITAGGGLQPVSKALKITPQAISQWDRVPAERVLALERITGVSRYSLRPDIYGERP